MEDEEIDKTDIRNFRKSILNVKNNNKTGIYINSEYKKEIANVNKWLKEINDNNITSLTGVKDYFASLEGQGDNRALKKYSGIVGAILSCKEFEEGQRIQFNSNLFQKKLNHFVLANNIKGKCLTNDYLYLQMISTSSALGNQTNQKLFRIAQLESALITSENFESNYAYKGYIQDYDPDFSAICKQGTSKGLIQAIVNNKQNEYKFLLSGYQYKSFGDDNIYVICQEELEDNDIISKFNKMKYIMNENNRLADGQKEINFNEGLYYIDKYVVAENFCPAFIVFDNEVTFKYLFCYQFDYNDLFDFLEKNEWPDNLCYWDTINYCFDFLFVFSLTSKRTKKDREIIQEWCLKYLSLKPFISKWKDNQILLSRIINDFMYGFLNDSSYSRFLHLEKRCEKYLAVLKKLKADGMQTEVTNFFSSLPFATFIKNQLKDNVFNLAKQIKDVASAFVTGTKTANIIEKVREVARNIKEILPENDLSTACFPMIFADGALLGDKIKRNDPKSDPVFIKIQKNSIQRSRERKREKNAVADAIKTVSELNENIDDFVEGYIKRRTRTNAYKKEFLNNLRDIRNDIRGELLLKGTEEQKRTQELTADAIRWAKDKTKEVPISKRQPVIEEYIQKWNDIFKENDTESGPEPVREEEETPGNKKVLGKKRKNK